MTRRPNAPLPTLTIGAVIEGTSYRAVRKLGEGGMGAVYEVVHLPTGERRALKILRRLFVDDPAYEERFMLEVRALERLNGAPHIVRIFEQGRTRGRPYYVMEFIEGKTLYDRLLDDGPLLPAEAFDVVRQVLVAVRAVHWVGVVHRDIKPENIVLRPNGEAVLLDFGAVKALTENGLMKRLFPTPPLQRMGTGPYLPPELVYDRTPDERGDLYAVGVVLFECLLGGLPYRHVRTDAYYAHVVRHGFPTLSEVGVRVSAKLERVVRRAMSPWPDARYQTAEAFAFELSDAIAPAERTGHRPPAAPTAPRVLPAPPNPPALPAPPKPPAPLASALVAPAALAPMAPRPPRPAVLGAALLSFASLATGVAGTLAVLGSMGWIGPSAPTVRAVAEPRASVRPDARTGAAPAPEAPRPADVKPPADVRPPAASATARLPSALASAANAGDQRARLEAKMQKGQATAEDAKELATLCRRQGDEACQRRALAAAKELGGKR